MKLFGFPVAAVVALTALAAIIPVIFYIPFALPLLYLLTGVLLANTFRHTAFRIKLAVCIPAFLVFTWFVLSGHDPTGVGGGAVLLAWVSFFSGLVGAHLFIEFRYREDSK